MNRFIPDTIRGRLVATFTLLFVLVAAPLTYFVVQQAQSVAEQRAETQFGQQALIIGTALSSVVTNGDIVALQSELEALAGVTGYSLAVHDASGQLLASVPSVDGSSARTLESTALPPDGSASTGVMIADDGTWATAVAAVPGSAGTVLTVVTPAGELDSLVSGLWRRALPGIVLALVIVGSLSWGVARRISAPLEHLQQQASAISAGNLTVRVEPGGPRDIRGLTGAFNTMTGRIHSLINESDDARRRLEMIFENLREGVLVVDGDEQVVAENRRAREILGNGSLRGAGKPFVVVVRDHDLLNHLRSTIREGSGSTVPIEYVRSGRSIEATAIPVLNERAQFSIVVLRDVTELRRLESVRREFVANVSHELRTPLASIRALADTLESGALEDPEVSLDFVQRIVMEVDRLTVLVDELLDLARLESGRITLLRQPTSPAELISAGVERLRPQIERAGLSLSLNVPADLPLVYADRARVEQVLLNLVHNAIKFTPAGGGISVVAHTVEPMLHVDISDTGQGIPETELPRVFERFYKADRSRRSDGTGLGLAISKHIVLAHRGEIWVTSVPGRGSTFSFSLPIVGNPAGVAELLPDIEQSTSSIDIRAS